MKIPEPIATVTDNFATDFSEIGRTWQKPIPIGTKLYDKQAMLYLLEAAAVECEKQLETGAHIRCAAAVRKLKENL